MTKVNIWSADRFFRGHIISQYVTIRNVVIATRCSIECCVVGDLIAEAVAEVLLTQNTSGFIFVFPL